MLLDTFVVTLIQVTLAIPEILSKLFLVARRSKVISFCVMFLMSTSNFLSELSILLLTSSKPPTLVTGGLVSQSWRATGLSWYVANWFCWWPRKPIIRVVLVPSVGFPWHAFQVSSGKCLQNTMDNGTFSQCCGSRTVRVRTNTPYTKRSATQVILGHDLKNTCFPSPIIALNHEGGKVIIYYF